MFTRIDITWANSTITDVGRIRQRFMGEITNITGRPICSSKWNQTGTEETGLDTVEKDRGGGVKVVRFKRHSHFVGYQRLFLFVTSDTVAIFAWTKYWFFQL